MDGSDARDECSRWLCSFLRSGARPVSVDSVSQGLQREAAPTAGSHCSPCPRAAYSQLLRLRPEQAAQIDTRTNHTQGMRRPRPTLTRAPWCASACAQHSRLRTHFAITRAAHSAAGRRHLQSRGRGAKSRGERRAAEDAAPRGPCLSEGAMNATRRPGFEELRRGERTLAPHGEQTPAKPQRPRESGMPFIPQTLAVRRSDAADH